MLRGGVLPTDGEHARVFVRRRAPLRVRVVTLLVQADRSHGDIVFDLLADGPLHRLIRLHITDLVHCHLPLQVVDRFVADLFQVPQIAGE